MSVWLDTSSISLARTTGVVQYVKNLIEAFDAMDPDCGVVARSYRGLEAPSGRKTTSLASEMTRMQRRLHLLSREYLWRRCLRGGRVQAIHIPFTYGPYARLPGPYLLTAMDLRFLHLPGTYPPLRRLFLRFMAPRSLRNAACVLAISNYTARDLSERVEVDSRRVVVTHLAADERFYARSSASDMAMFRERLALRRPYVLYVGYIEPRKNLARLIRAFSELVRREGIDHELVIAGYRYWGYDDLDMALSESACAERVRFLGHVNDEFMPALYRGASAFVLPSLFEGFGIPLVEAMASGTPVVASNVTSLPEVLDGAGVLVDPGSVESIAGGLGAVLLDARLREDLIERGFRRARDFSWRNTAEKTLSTYRDVLSGVYA